MSCTEVFLLDSSKPKLKFLHFFFLLPNQNLIKVHSVVSKIEHADTQRRPSLYIHFTNIIQRMWTKLKLA